MKYLIVVAHPDDEVLGAGASIHKWAQSGVDSTGSPCNVVEVAIMSAEAKARAFRPEDNELQDDTNANTEFLGVTNKYEWDFPNIEMNRWSSEWRAKNLFDGYPESRQRKTKSVQCHI